MTGKLLMYPVFRTVPVDTFRWGRFHRRSHVWSGFC